MGVDEEGARVAGVDPTNLPPIRPQVFVEAAASAGVAADAEQTPEDIIEWPFAQRSDSEAQTFFDAVLENIDTGVVACDAEGQLTLFNRASRELLGIPLERVSPGDWSSHYGLYRVDGRTPLPLEEVPLYRALMGEVVQNAEVVVAPADGAPHTLLVNGRAFSDGDGRVLGAVVAMHDVTEQRRAQDQLLHQTLHDPLTGLPNRLLLMDRLDQALSDSARRGREIGVAFVDLDHFKRINDSFGHQAGDAVLVQVAARLSEGIRVSDTLARLSGDEFVVVWRDVASAAAATLLTNRLAEALKEPFDLGTATVKIAASIGAVVGRPDDRAEDLLKMADAAMYEAKQRGGGRVRVFSIDSRRGVKEMMTTEVDLRAALTGSELVVHYQPVIDVSSGRPVAVEALVRWQHPLHGLLEPAHFVPAAEMSGLIVPLGRWVLERACRDAAAFTGPAEGLDVAVNLSVRQLTQPDLVSHVYEALVHSGLDPQRLILEVTESAVMEDAEAAAVALDELSHLGVRIAIDDFGTGYSSLLYLRLNPISALKLDRAFVSGIGVNGDDEAICGSVVNLAHAVGATSIGEGVETIEQYAALRALGCEQAQGFFWSPAVPLGELPGVLLACAEVPRPPAARPRPAVAMKRNSVAVIARAAAAAADKTAEAAETARGATAVAVAVAAEAVALTATETAAAVQIQADASASKVAEAASEAAAAVAASLIGGGDAASTLTASRVAATVTAAAVANSEETALAAAIVARAVAAAAAQAAFTASAAAIALEEDVSNAAAAVRAVTAATARTTNPNRRE
jgi:diguanylate cyclase (GGDEF)-like protein/PAS domain S-box-containing protein